MKLLDFGLARSTDAPPQPLTQADLIVGTLNYLSPEQVQGDPVDARTDLFSLGVVLYEMLTAERPFERIHLVATLSAIGSSVPREMDASIPSDIANVVRRLLEKRPDDRYASAEEAIVAIDNCQQQPSTTQASNGHGPTSTKRTIPSSPALPKKHFYPFFAAAAAALLLACVIITIRDKDGNVIARLYAPKDADVRIEQGDSQEAATVKDAESVIGNTPPTTSIIPHSENVLPAMSPLALVQHPAKLTSKTGEPVLSWTLATRQLIGGGLQIPSLRPDGKLLAVFGDDGYLRIWDVQSGRLLQLLVGHTAGPAWAAPDGNRVYMRTNSRRFGPVAWQGSTPLVATASRDGHLRVWDVETGQLVFQHGGPVDGINMLAWSPDGTMLAATYTHDGSVRCWHAEDWKEVEALDPLRRIPRCLAWSPDSTTLAVSTDQGSLLWKPRQGMPRALPQTPRINYETAQCGTGSLRWSPDGTHLAFIKDGSVKITDADSFGSVQQLISIDDAPAVPGDFSWSPDGQQMLVRWRSGDKQVHHIYDVKSGVIVRSLPDYAVESCSYLDWLADGRTAIVDSQLIDLKTGQIRRTSHPQWEASLDGEWVLSSDEHGLPLVLRNEGGSTLLKPIFANNYIRWHGQVAAVFSPDGASLALTDSGVNLSQLLDRTASPSRRKLHVYPEAIRMWSPDGRLTLTGDPANGGGRIYSWPDGKVVRKLDGIGVTAHAWSVDGTKLAVAASDRSLRVFDVSTGETAGPWLDPVEIKNYINTIAWSNDGSRLAVGSGNLGIAILAAPTGTRRIDLESDASINMGAARLSWTPDGKRVLLLGDNDALVYDPDTGKLIQRISARVTPLSIGGWPGKLPIHFKDEQTFQFLSASGHLSEARLDTGETNVVRPIPGDGVQFSTDGQYLIVKHGNVSQLRKVESGQLLASFVNSDLHVGSDGHFWTPHNPSGPHWPTAPRVEETFVYIVQTARGQRTLTPLAFANEYGWENKPLQVQIK